MTTRLGNRFALSQIVSFAMAELRLAMRAAPDLARQVAPFVAWAAIAMGLGALVGVTAVALPPLASFAIVAAVGVVLLWVMPEVPLVFPRLIRKLFVVMFVVNICVPYYYMVQFGDLPWISVRRIVAFAFIGTFLLAVASSAQVRQRVVARASSSRLILCAIGYLVMAIISIPESGLLGYSMSALTDAILTWYVPLAAIIYVVEDENDLIRIFKVISFCAILISGLGVIEFHYNHRFLADVFPQGMLASLAQSNPMLAQLADGTASYRNGIFRASSIFLVPLSFGEFEIMVIPIGLFFAIHRQNLFERCIGWAVVIGGMAGIFVSGSRGGYVGFIASMATFVVIWSIRKAISHRNSLIPAIVGVMGTVTFAIVIMLILFWPRAHNMVLGGGAEEASTQGRWVQWAAAWPLIKSNPIIGHGFVTGGFDIGSSIDSYVISLLVETGVPGFLFFTGMVCLPIWYGVRAYLTDLSESGALAGTLACSFIAFTFYRLALSERENHFLMFTLLGMVVMLNYGYQQKFAKETQSYRARRPSYSRPRRPGLGAV
jgi:hypothetical protein